jgi:hypothetical protein
MTFPSSTFPRSMGDDRIDALRYVMFWTQPIGRFPIFRSSPLWEPTWLDRKRRGREYWSPIRNNARYQYAQDPDEPGWFPPLTCGETLHVNCTPRVERRRLYSSPHCRCATCLENAQTVELMLQGVARAERDRPDVGHSCYWREPDGRKRYDCTCGMPYSWLNVGQWHLDEEGVVCDWAWKNRCANNDILPATTTASLNDMIQSLYIGPLIAEWSRDET